MALRNKALAVGVLALAIIACGSSAPRRLNLYPSPTVLPTQTERIVVWTATPLSTYTPIVKEVTSTPNPEYLCVTATVAVHLRPSPSSDNYPVMVLPNGARLTDLGGRNGNWSFVSYGDKSGWVNSDYTKNCK